MRNRCKHKKIVILIESPYAHRSRWVWCTICGATRLDKFDSVDKSSLEVTWKIGKWKSPSIITEK